MDGVVHALTGRAATALTRPDLPWAARWQELAAVVAGLSELVLAGRGARVVAQELAELLVDAVPRHRPHRARLTELVDRVVDLHAVACADDPAAPEELARWLLHLQTGFAEPPEVRLAPYAAALGAEGLERYRSWVVERFERLPVIGFGRTGRYDRERWALLRVVEELAEHTGDVDLQVLVLTRDLSSGWHYLRVATVLRDAGRSEEAVEWVERGVVATRGRGSAGPLVDLGVDECLRVGWAERAVGLRLRVLLEHPTAGAWHRLRVLAAGTVGWPGVRERAVAALARDGDLPEWVSEQVPEPGR
ncbi:hypothetical protein CKY47_33815 [Saccharothrix yanglingensis]|uniref:Uncharacterized protein n=1 Tax=Saccharothrix yanglingensis TaxID=659496 RepID=A0ABU0X9W5_9PSEU|nr:hypothetical protein [Saccharothrix yanglingensis]